MKYRAVIFDFDYTLGDSTEGIVKSVNYGLEKLGCSHCSRDAIRKTIGLSLKETYRMLTGDKSEEQGEHFAGYFVEMADKVMVEHTSLFPDTMDMLCWLKNQNLKIGIVTTKYHYRIDAILEKCQAAEYIDLIVGGEDVTCQKPHPEGILLALDSWNMSAEEILYVGDSQVDGKTAEAAGVDFAGVATGTTSEEKLRQYPSIGVYQSLGELQQVLQCSERRNGCR